MEGRGVHAPVRSAFRGGVTGKKLPVQNVTCTECHSHVEAAPRHSFLGLPKFECPRCGKAFLYPMTARRRKAYVGIAVFFGLLFVAVIVVAHVLPIPGILPVAAVAGLVQDSNARKKVAAAEASVASGPIFTP
jgi:predicted RNA-binding Zn-ribbon protein involved in translation (DUF1610 family)